MSHPALATQLARLRKHWIVCRKGYDEVALLDLAHSLRVISEAEVDVVRLMTRLGIKGLPHGSIRPKLKRLIGDAGFLAVLLPGGLKAGCIEASTIIRIDRALSELELSQVKQLLHAHIAGEKLSPARWFAAEVVVARRTTSGGPERLGLSRTMAVKRVANTLGASHFGVEGGSNRFDWVVELMNNMQIAGVPAPYCVLMKIAQDLLFALDSDFADMDRKI